MGLDSLEGYKYLAGNAGLILVVDILIGFMINPWKSQGNEKTATRTVVTLLMLSIEMLLGAFLTLTLIWGFSASKSLGIETLSGLTKLGFISSRILLPAGVILLIVTLVKAALRFSINSRNRNNSFIEETLRENVSEGISKKTERKCVLEEKLSIVGVVAIFIFVSVYTAICAFTPTSVWLQGLLGTI
jgi:hypothetical protein